MHRLLSSRSPDAPTSAIEYGFVAGLVTVACIVALTSLGDSLQTVRSAMATPAY